jgi:ParB family chromosome partitioning protein
VADFSGRVISGSTYAMACRAIGMQVRVYYVPATKAKMVADYFGRSYGEFSYEHLPKIPSLQTFAQPFRLRNSKTPNKSRSYEDWVIPNLGRQQRHLDFGCGQGDYIRYLQKNGYNSWGVEFFFRRGNAINKSAVRRMIDETIEAIREGGLFDHVMMDFVLNSVVDVQAAHDVLTCVGAFCKPGGTVYVSGRLPTMGEMGTKSRGAGAIQVLFLDDYGFSGQIHRGGWFYQLHNTKDQANEIMAAYYNPTFKMRFAGTKWMAMATKTVCYTEEMYAGAIEREFDLPWVGGERVGRAEAMLEVWRPAFREAHKGEVLQEWEGLPYIKPEIEQHGNQ